MKHYLSELNQNSHVTIDNFTTDQFQQFQPFEGLNRQYYNFKLRAKNHDHLPPRRTGSTHNPLGNYHCHNDLT